MARPKEGSPSRSRTNWASRYGSSARARSSATWPRSTLANSSIHCWPEGYQMGDVLAFWLVAMLIALLAFPITSVLLRRLPDAGAGMSFAAGLLLAGYGYFILRTFS